MSSTRAEPGRDPAQEQPSQAQTGADPEAAAPEAADPGAAESEAAAPGHQAGAASAGDREPPPTGLGAFIRGQRRLADMSLREMANLTSVSNAYLSQIERGLHQPSLRVLRSIAQALRIAPEDLLRRANFMTAKDEAGDGSAAPDTEAAIRADPRLSPAQREALLNVYRSFRTPD